MNKVRGSMAEEDYFLFLIFHFLFVICLSSFRAVINTR